MNLTESIGTDLLDIDDDLDGMIDYLNISGIFDNENIPPTKTPDIVNLYRYGLMLSDITRNITIWMNPILIVVGLVVNLLVIMVFCRLELRKLSISIHTIGLAVSDTFLLLIPILLNTLKEYDSSIAFFNTTVWCKFHGYLDISFCSWSAWNIVFLSNDRWSAICRPALIYSREANTRAIIIVLLVPLVSMSFFSWIPLSIESGHEQESSYQFLINAGQIDDLNYLGFNSSSLSSSSLPSLIVHNKSSDVRYCRPKNNLIFFIAGLVGILFAYFVPFLLISFYNVRIIRTLMKRIIKRKEYFSGTLHFKYLNSNLEMIDAKIPASASRSCSTTTSSNKSTACRSNSSVSFLQSLTSWSSHGKNSSSITKNNGTNIKSINNQFYLKAQRKSSLKSTTMLIGLRNLGSVQIEEAMNTNNAGGDCKASTSTSASGGNKSVSIFVQPDESASATRKSRHSKSNSIFTILDGKRTQFSSNAMLLRAREHLNQYQRLKNDKSINMMLITVSIAFLVLTFPYQIFWICEKLFLEVLHEKEKSNELNSSLSNRTEELVALRVIASAMKDLCLVVRNLNFSINFFLYSTMSNLFRRELNFLFQRIGLYNFMLFKNSISTSTHHSDRSCKSELDMNSKKAKAKAKQKTQTGGCGDGGGEGVIKETKFINLSQHTRSTNT